MAELEGLRELHAFMREVNASYAKCGALELRLEPLPPQSVPVDAPFPVDHGDDERRSLETLLHSAGVDAAPFFEAVKRLRAA